MIQELSADQARDALGGLSALLIDVVRAGGEVNFLENITQDQASAFWLGTLPRVAAGDILLFVARDDDGPVLGTVQLELIRKPNQPHRAEVAKLLVHSQARRRGIGEALMRHLEARALQEGRTILTLDTATGGAGHALYHKLGFIDAGDIPGYSLKTDGSLGGTTFLYKQIAPPLSFRD